MVMSAELESMFNSFQNNQVRSKAAQILLLVFKVMRIAWPIEEALPTQFCVQNLFSASSFLFEFEILSLMSFIF